MSILATILHGKQTKTLKIRNSSKYQTKQKKEWDFLKRIIAMILS